VLLAEGDNVADLRKNEDALANARQVSVKSSENSYNIENVI